LTWSASTGSATGGSAILSYQLIWNAGSGTPSASLTLTNSLVTTYTVTGLTAGTTYDFELRTRNIYGYSSYSSTLSIKARDVPDTMSPPVIT